MQIQPNLVSLFGLNIQGDFGGMTCYRSARHRFTWFASTTPKVPASIVQTMQRAKWRAMAHVWRSMPLTDRAAWTAAAAAAHIRISGYNLWMHCATTGDEDILATINRQTGSDLTLQTRTI